jgi:hypothetical protein
MDAVKLKNSCICGNTLPYVECCGVYAAPLERAAREGAGARSNFFPATQRAEFRHDLHDLYMYLFPHRNLYQAYWERLSQETYPHHLLMADADYGRSVMANFFWDYSVQFSDARPILRAARDVEEKDLRLANDFRQWSLAPLWVWRVLESDGRQALVRMVDSAKTFAVGHGGELPGPGGLFAGRIVEYRGGAQAHPAVLVFPTMDDAVVKERLRNVYRALGVKSGVGLRPDVHCDEWRRHGALILALWRETVYDANVGSPARTMAPPQSFRLPLGVPAAGSAGVERADIAAALRFGGAVALDARPGATRFDLRFRALTLARLEVEADGWLNVTLLDEAYRSYVFRWLADHLDASARTVAVASGVSGALARASGAGETGGVLPAPGHWIEWAQTPHADLGGETPLEARDHDFGRRRLNALLSRLTFKTGELSALRRHLGL